MASSASPSELPSAEPSANDAPEPRPGLKVALDLGSILEHCKCSICMGIIKNTRAVSACMHRFCKDCIEAWLRTQIENNCPQCRVKFASKRDCKPDPNFDLLLAAMFGDIEAFERQMLDPSAEVLQRAMSIGQQIAAAAYQRPSPLPATLHARSQQQVQQQPQQSSQPRMADATVHVAAARPAPKPAAAPAVAASAAAPAAAAAARSAAAPAAAVAPARASHAPSNKRPPPPGFCVDGKRLRGSGEEDGGALQYRGVRFQGDNWQARTKRNSRELSLGLYNTAEEAGMAYDLDRLQQQGGKAQRLNFPLLRQHYKQILADLADMHTPDGLLDFLAVAVQSAAKAARAVPGATAAENTGPAAASVLNPRRPILPSGMEHPGEEHLGTHSGAAHDLPAAAAAVAAAGSESEYSDPEESPSPETSPEPSTEPEEQQQEMAPVEPVDLQAAAIEQHAAARAQAEQLAATRSLADGLAGGLAHVRLQVGSGPTWRMAWLACPAGASVGQLAEAVAVGLSQQHRFAPGALAVGLAVANDLDSSADFDALCYEDAATGNLLLRGHVTVRDLLGTLEDSAEDLCLEYFATLDAEEAAAAAAAVKPEPVPAPA